MNELAINAFVTVCAFANPTDCKTLTALSDMVPGYTLQACKAESARTANKYIDAHMPGYIISRVRCTFIEARKV